MNLRSLAYRTSLIFPRFEGEIWDRGDYMVVRTPSNPTFWWGNFLIFPDPPGPGDLPLWEECFASEIGASPDTHHRTFGWDTTTGERGAIEPFLEAGYQLVESVVLTAKSVNPPPKICAEVVVRPLQSDDDWEHATRNQIVCRDTWHEEESFTPYKVRQMVRYRQMSEAGLGDWYGAFIEGQLVGDFGVYQEGELARFQSVVVHPDFRRRGICGTMIHFGSLHALARPGVETLVMEADPEYHAARIYESVGFLPTEQSLGIEYRPVAEG